MEDDYRRWMRCIMACPQAEAMVVAVSTLAVPKVPFISELYWNCLTDFLVQAIATIRVSLL